VCVRAVRGLASGTFAQGTALSLMISIFVEF
jgi:hypothetical protein